MVAQWEVAGRRFVFIQDGRRGGDMDGRIILLWGPHRSLILVDSSFHYQVGVPEFDIACAFGSILIGVEAWNRLGAVTWRILIAVVCHR